MRLTGKLKEIVDKAESKNQAKEIIARAGMELTDEEIEQVTGGRSITIGHMEQRSDNPFEKV